MKSLLFLYLLLNFGLVFVLPSWRVWKTTGVNPITFSGHDDAHDFVGGAYKVVIALLFVVVACYSFGGEWYAYTLPVWYLDIPVLDWVGGLLLTAALIWIAMAQREMGKSWRIGIDEQHQTDLVSTGVFGRSRNPIFLGMLAGLLGLFLVIPNALTLLLLVSGWLLMSVQIRLEEAFLERQHGADYASYRQRVRRWI